MNCPRGALEDDIATLAAHIAAAEYRFLCLVAELDRRQDWAAHGLKSAALWLAWRCGVGLNAGREKVRVAQALEQVPMISEAFAAGRPNLARNPGEQDAIDLAQRAEQQRRVAWRWDTDGSLIIEKRLLAELGMLVIKALDAATLAP